MANVAPGCAAGALGEPARMGDGRLSDERHFRVPLSAVVICVCLVVVVVSLVVYVDSLSFTVRPTYASADSNPLMGFAAAADDKSAAENEQLVYIDLTWAEWEPEEGTFDIAALEKKNNIARWRAEGKHAVLRFVCDVPGNEAHRDIPQWLYEQTGDGADYDNEYGKGYAPDYSNATFRAAHARAIAALGAWASQDTFVSYVELGSLGHWGEWHTLEESGVPAMPEERLCQEYYSQYQSAFPQARLLTRRNYALSVDSGAGVYNDMTGSSDDTLEWLAWQLAGGAQQAADHEITYSPVEDIWRTAPVGGEFTSSLDMGYMLGDNIVQTLNLLRSSHMTFIGPHYPKGEYAESAGAHMVSGFLGYRLWVSELDVRFDALTRCWDITMEWRNDGVAPLYADWPVTLEVRDASGEVVYDAALPLVLSDLCDGEEFTVKASVPFDPRGFPAIPPTCPTASTCCMRSLPASGDGCARCAGVACDQADVWMARKQRCLHEDYEDNLVVAAAQRAHADCLVTNDQNLLEHSPVAALSCADALAYLQALEPADSLR